MSKSGLESFHLQRGKQREFLAMTADLRRVSRLLFTRSSLELDAGSTAGCGRHCWPGAGRHSAPRHGGGAECLPAILVIDYVV